MLKMDGGFTGVLRGITLPPPSPAEAVRAFLSPADPWVAASWLLRRLRVETASVADGALAAVSRSSPVVRERLFQKSTEFLDVMELFIGRPTGLWLWPGCRTTFSVGGAARRRCSGCWRSRALTTRSGGRRGH